MAYYVAFDIGGTFIKYALLQDEGTIINKAKVETPHSLNELYQVLTHIVNAFKQTHHIEGIAISAPGAVDSDTGIIKGASALPYIHGPNIKTDLEKLTNLRVEIENDANCAALAEVWLGNAKNTKDAMFVVIGTGIGGQLLRIVKFIVGFIFTVGNLDILFKSSIVLHSLLKLGLILDQQML